MMVFTGAPVETPAGMGVMLPPVMGIWQALFRQAGVWLCCERRIALYSEAVKSSGFMERGKACLHLTLNGRLKN